MITGVGRLRALEHPFRSNRCRFDPRTGAWEDLAPMLRGRSVTGATALSTGIRLEKRKLDFVGHAVKILLCSHRRVERVMASKTQ